MKRIEIIIPHGRVEDVHEIIETINTGGMSYYSIEGSGRVKAERIIIGRGTDETIPQYIPRAKVEVVVKDDQVEELLSKLTNKLSSEFGGKIFVADIPIAINLRSKKRGEEAI